MTGAAHLLLPNRLLSGARALRSKAAFPPALSVVLADFTLHVSATTWDSPQAHLLKEESRPLLLQLLPCVPRCCRC